MSHRRPIGRPRRTDCFIDHVPGVRCTRCARAWQTAWRARRPTVETKRVRVRSDAEHLAGRARAYVWTYLRRGAITPPQACERCGQPGPLTFWHPNHREQRDVMWVCLRDRARVRSGEGPVTLTWLWPDGSNAQPRVIERWGAPEAAVTPSDSEDEPLRATLLWPITRAGAEQWLASLPTAEAEAIRAAAASVHGITLSREAPLYGMQLVRRYAQAAASSSVSVTQ